MAKRKTVARKTKARKAGKKAAPRKKAKLGSDTHTGRPTGREAQAMQRLQSLTERYMPADALTRAKEELRANPREDWRAG